MLKEIIASVGAAKARRALKKEGSAAHGQWAEDEHVAAVGECRVPTED
jgi:hypothetical protein